MRHACSHRYIHSMQVPNLLAGASRPDFFVTLNAAPRLLNACGAFLPRKARRLLREDKMNRYVRSFALRNLRSMALALAVAATMLPVGTTAWGDDDEGRADRGFVQTNLVSDLGGVATIIDPALRNPWGLSHSPTSPFWLSNQGTSTATL